MKKWKFLASLSLAAVLSVTCLAGCNAAPKASETFEGSVSTTTYESVESTVEGFLEAELNGNTTTAELVSYESQGELTTEELDALDLDEEVERPLSAEKVVITYSLSEVNGLAALAAAPAQDPDVKTQTAYILEYAGGIYRYYVPAQVVGEALTRTYFDDVTDPSKYINSTFTSNISLKETVSMMGQTASVKSEVKQTLKFTEKMIALLVTGTENGENMHQEQYLLMLADGSFVDYSYSEYEECWQGYPVYAYETIGEFWREFFIEFDFSYFEKTDTGFGISGDKLLAAFGSLELEEYFTVGKTAMNYVVSEGKIASMSIKYDMSVTMVESGYTMTTKITGSGKGTISNIGSTTITLPAELQAQIAADGYTLA